MFFGMVRQSCGGDDHPSANMFLYVFRLLSVSSLIKPGRRASVQSEPASIMLTVQSGDAQSKRLPFIPAIESLLDGILDADASQPPADFSIPVPDMPHSVSLPTDISVSNVLPDDTDFLSEEIPEFDVSETAQDSILPSTPSTSSSFGDHNYCSSSPQSCILHYLGGYVAHKLSKCTSCSDCIATLSDPGNLTSASVLVELRTNGGLKLPSTQLTALIDLLEHCFATHSTVPATNMYFDILHTVLMSDSLPAHTIGCEMHRNNSTSRCIHF